MRNLFIVLAKVVGLLQIATAIWQSEPLIRSFFAIQRWRPSFSPAEIYGDIIGRCLMICLYLGFAWVLLLRSSWLADRLGLVEWEIQYPEPDTLLWIGIKLFGLYVLVESVPALIWSAMEPKGVFSNPPNPTHFWMRVIPAAAKFMIGFILVVKTRYIIELISRDAKSKNIASS